MHGRYKKKNSCILCGQNREMNECRFILRSTKVKGKKRNKRRITQLSGERKQEIRAKASLSHRTHQSLCP